MTGMCPGLCCYMLLESPHELRVVAHCVYAMVLLTLWCLKASFAECVKCVDCESNGPFGLICWRCELQCVTLGKAA